MKYAIIGTGNSLAMLHYYMLKEMHGVVFIDDRKEYKPEPIPIIIEKVDFPETAMYIPTKADRRNWCIPNRTQRKRQEQHLRTRFKSQK